jgi:tellurite resistance protein TerC
MHHSIGTPLFSAVFLVIVLFLLLVDLGLLQRKARAVTVREATVWSAVWVALSALFGVWIYYRFGHQSGLEFFAGYLIEYALSVDNIFVFILVFSYFSVPPRLHHRVLFWGILGALVMRGTFILAGTVLISRFHWVIYIFGAFLVATSIKLLRHGDTEVDPGRNPVVRLFQRVAPMTGDFSSDGFLVKRQGRWLATPLALVLVSIETTDLVFALDSIPAIFGVTTDPFIVYTSNVCAILGLRSMYFLLAAVIDRFAYLGTGLGIVLLFIGIKMLIGGIYVIPIGLSLGVVGGVLTVSVLLSLLHPPPKTSVRSSPLVPSDGTESEGE